MLTWNLGSLSCHHESVVSLLVSQAPHVVFLQEARVRPHEFRAFLCTLRSLGYVACRSSSHNLIVIWRRGLNFAPVDAAPFDLQWRLQFFALQVGQARLLLRHQHGPSGSRSDIVEDRGKLDVALQAFARSHVVVDIGDFNCVPASTSVRTCVFPPSHTFRLNAGSSTYTTTIDGACVSPSLASGAVAEFVSGDFGTQHRPVRVVLRVAPATHDRFVWVHPAPGLPQWTPERVAAFRSALITDIDEAWAIWHVSSGGQRRNSYAKLGAHGSWAVSGSDSTVNSLWRKQRQALALRTAEGDLRAQRHLSEIQAILKADSQANLQKWKQTVQTRSGAAAWVKRRLALLVPVTLSLFGSAHLSYVDAARSFATQLASRWNVGCHTCDLESSNLSSICLEGPSLSMSSCPAPRVSPSLPGLYFSDVPAVSAPNRWLPGEIQAFASSGSCGLDGWDRDSLCNLDEVSSELLCQLFNAADVGRFPQFWKEAKVTGIPKKGSSEFRPLTILSGTYRLWARRRAFHLAFWFNRWAPPGLFGARKKVGASDAASLGSLRVEGARLGASGPLHLASTDMEKYFDRLLLPTLRELARMAKLDPSLFAVLDLYSSLRRQIFLDGCPTQFILSGAGSCGVPQGCPLACFFTNLVAAALDAHMRLVPGVELITYLDDRIFFASSSDVLEQALSSARVFDVACGCSCNLSKSCYACLNSQPGLLGAILRGMPRARSSFPYLGIDVLVGGRAARPLAKQRFQSFLQRCALVSHLPSSQRSACTADAVASLWLSAGSLYTVSEFAKMSSAAAAALRPSTKRRGLVMLRSRVVEHLVGGRFHRTYPPAAAMYDVSKQVSRLLVSERLSRPFWDQLWQARLTAVSSPLVVFERVARFLSFFWSDSVTLMAADSEFCLLNSSELSRSKHSHALRDVIRVSACAFEAARRHKDFAGASSGILMDLARECYRVPYGLSLLTGGAWTAARLYLAGLVDSPLCVRCGACWDTKEHRLWWCDDNSDLLDRLLRAHPQLRVVDLPPCLLRCGLVPAKFNRPFSADVVSFLLSTSRRATVALHAAYTAAQDDPPSLAPVVSSLPSSVSVVSFDGS